MELDIFTGAALLSLLTLTLMEVVLGIDNIVFISIIANRVKPEEQKRARNYGLILALVPRVLLLLAISWLVKLDKPIFEIESIMIPGGDHGEAHPLSLSWKGLILLLGGLFLIYKATTEIHEKLEGEEHITNAKRAAMAFGAAITQIVLINIVFSFDSILTAVGLVSVDEFGFNNAVTIMVIAVVLSLIIMLVFAGYISDFVNRHPTVKMLALSFLLMIGLLLVVEAFEIHVPKGYVYFSMGFSVLVEILNQRMRRNSPQPVHFHNMPDYEPEGEKKPGV